MALAEFLNSTHRSIAWFKQAHEAGHLEMRPPFQRNLVWTPIQKSFLMDTILRGYPIPELYMQSETTPEGIEKHIVVDGQQRIQACLDFLGGRVSLDPENNPAYSDMTFDDLSADDRKKVFSYMFVVRIMPIIPEPILREVFQRLNRNNLVLNDQELRHATYWGPFIKLMESLADQDEWEEFGIFTARDVRRMLDIEYVSELAVALLHGHQNKKATLDRWYKTYETAFDDESKVRTAFRSTIGELKSLLPELRQTRWRKKSDFYTLFLVFAGHVGQLPLSAGKRKSATRALGIFATSVELYLTAAKIQDTKIMSKLPKRIGRYAAAVERAASDLANRKARHDALEEALLGIF